MQQHLVLAYPNMRWHKQDINTTRNLYPTTLLLLAAMVRDMVRVTIIDAQFDNLSREAFALRLGELRPDYVGLSLLTTEYAPALQEAVRLTKEACPAAKIIVGGVHVTTSYASVMADGRIDYGVVGEGEEVLRELLLFLMGAGPFPTVGLVYRAAGQVIAQPIAHVADMTKLPRPAYDLIDFKPYTLSESREFDPTRAPEYPAAAVHVARGCPCGCCFCQVQHISGVKIRARAPAEVVAELEFLKEKYGIRSVLFNDDNLLMAGGGFAKRLFRLMIERRLDLKWINEGVALFVLDDELLDLMRDSGCVGVNVAIESGNARVLHEIVHKPIKDLRAVPAIIAKIKARGIFCLANFIIGFPGETWAEIRETIAFAETCGADYAKIYFAVPLPGTELYDLALRLGVLAVPPEELVVDWRYSQIQSPEWTAKDISILRCYEWDRINFAPHKIQKLSEITGLSIERLQAVRKATRDALTFA